MKPWLVLNIEWSDLCCFFNETIWSPSTCWTTIDHYVHWHWPMYNVYIFLGGFLVTNLWKHQTNSNKDPSEVTIVSCLDLRVQEFSEKSGKTRKIIIVPKFLSHFCGSPPIRKSIYGEVVAWDFQIYHALEIIQELVGGIPTLHLWKKSQLAWYSQYMEKKTCSEPPTSKYASWPVVS